MSQTAFFEAAISAQALKFGKFTLKSGRISPYFFNAGLFNDGQKLTILAECYAEKIISLNLDFDVLFGPAYKGIPLAALIASVLYQKYGRTVGFCYNRKEAKDHGEGGVLVGSDIAGKGILIVDDVITAGTAIKEAIALIAANKGNIRGIMVALDRQEVAPKMKCSAIQALKQQYDFAVCSVANSTGLIEYMSGDINLDNEVYHQMKEYQQKYGI